MAVPIPDLVSQGRRGPTTSDESPAPSSVFRSNDNSGTRFARGLLYSVPLSVVMWLLVGLTVLGLSI